MHYEIIESEDAFRGYFVMRRYRLRHARFEGGMGPVLTRELFERGHSVGVLPYDPVRDQVVLVEQFRVGALDAPRGPWLIETIAGIIEPGESPEAVARRESVEEANCPLDEVVPICRYLVSPGGTSEQVSMFCARVDAEGLHGGVHGLEEEGEDILVHVMSFDEAMAMVENGTVHAAMPLIALQWLALNRERLREQWGAD
ncbi:ADP-ribose pyrophosphatase [wastewater metagenome]|uniref:ADP-ribose pyrophosphatase n=2 Tax=unclassified sequences TaxID=12908 RepID=A0A5B8RGL2_9ZZZZ|nr:MULTISPECIES: NUDIX domain-containing protein [Arhodomonas]MCS4503643.1 NUDIX domain-containing protein [Arhodomonas aquaeolei]QEA06634.1 ADP-ribose pyrophosphatase [uncultured organism]